MYAIEFETKTDGKYIKLPFEIEANHDTKIKVLLLSSKNLQKKKSKRLNLTTFKKGKKIADFNREDAYFMSFEPWHY
jgi:hypothetical protein